MTTSSNRQTPIRAAANEWGLAAVFLVGYALTVLQAWDAQGWRGGATAFLAGIGFVIVMLVKGTTNRHRLHPDDRHRVNVLAAQALAVFLVATIVNGMYPSPAGVVPVVLSIAGVGTLLLAAEALVISRRDPRRRST